MNEKQGVLPPPLAQGATIGIIAPAGPLRDKDAFSAGVRILHEWGFKTKFPRTLWPGNGFCADSDERRSAELHQVWCDSEVDAIIAARGGYGSLRIAKRLDTNTLSQKAKLFIGYSDITCLHQCINEKCQLATLHGPVITSLAHLDRKSLDAFHHILFSGLASWQMAEKLEVIRGGHSVSGFSAGGNLSTIVSTLGTLFHPEWADKIIFLEDTGEAGYKIDRMLTQLALNGLFCHVAGVILGDFSQGLGLDSNGKYRLHEDIAQRVLELIPETAPLWINAPFGHGSTNMPFPLGARIYLDAYDLRIRLRS